jgi:hypothetical protein
MMRVHLQIALATQRQVHDGMLREQREHMIEKRNTRFDRPFPGAINIESRFDPRFFGVALNGCAPRTHARALKQR